MRRWCRSMKLPPSLAAVGPLPMGPGSAGLGASDASASTTAADFSTGFAGGSGEGALEGPGCQGPASSCWRRGSSHGCPGPSLDPTAWHKVMGISVARPRVGERSPEGSLSAACGAALRVSGGGALSLGSSSARSSRGRPRAHLSDLRCAPCTVGLGAAVREALRRRPCAAGVPRCEDLCRASRSGGHRSSILPPMAMALEPVPILLLFSPR
mmetsp:Transcript_94520/g.282222  ORF Transcript_94520/g.282222 Transcript_94520/m.282222 type:complete len:212 (+) Transcript_94520:467-1102(+)